MEYGLGGLMGDMPVNTTMLPHISQPKDIRIVQVVGGYTINKHGDKHYPLEVCVTIDEVLAKVNEFFTQESDKTNEIQESAPKGENTEAEQDKELEPEVEPETQPVV